MSKVESVLCSEMGLSLMEFGLILKVKQDLETPPEFGV